MQKRCYWAIVFLTFSFINIPLAYSELNDIQFHHYDNRNGLSNNSIESIIQDSKGFLWVGTHDGLNRFNGSEFEVFKQIPNDSNSIPGNFVSNIFEDRVHNIWVSSYGIAKYSYTQGGFKRYFSFEKDQTSICNNVTHSFFEDNDGDLYVASSEGIAVYNSKTDNFKRLRNSSHYGSLSNNNVLCFAQQVPGKIWVGTDGGGLNLYDKKSGQFTRFLSEEQTIKSIKALTFVANGILWIGTLNEGIFVYDVKTNRIIKRYQNNGKSANTLSSNEITTIYKDCRSNIWVGHINGGVSLYQPLFDNFKTFLPEKYNPYTIHSLSITTIYEDSFNTIWFGGHGGSGLSFFNYNQNTFKHYEQIPLKKNWLESNMISTFAEDDKKQIWVGTDGDGVYSFSPKDENFRHFTKSTGLPGNNILGLIYTGNNTLIGAGWGIGLFEMNTNDGSTHEIKSGSEKVTNVKSISRDADKNFWIATHVLRGIQVYDPTTNSFYNRENVDIYNQQLLEVAFSSYIFHDSKKRTWVCSYSGLGYYNKTFQRFIHNESDTNSISSDYIYSIIEDRNHHIWVATMNGLDLIEERNDSISFKHFNQYLGTTSIKSINEDTKNNLWLSSANEIIRFNPQTNETLRFPVEGNFNERASFRSSLGEMYFGSDKGFYVFHPDSLFNNTILPKVYITELLVLNKSQTVKLNDIELKESIQESKKIELSHWQSDITLKYVALCGITNSACKFKYRLENYDSNWIDAGTDRKISYKNIPPGKYTFRVKACNSVGVWNEDGASLEIIVRRPFWSFWWFRLVLGILIVLIIYGVFKYRLSAISKHNMLLKEMVKKQTEELVQQKEIQYRQEDLNKQLLLKQKEIEAENLKAEKELIQFRNTYLEKEVEYKTTDVTRKNAELSANILQIARKTELIENFKESLLELGKMDLKELNIRIKTMIKLIDTNESTVHEWEQFENIFNEIHQNFLNRIKVKFPELTSKDLRLCAYLRMNLSSKEIANLLNITAKGIEKSRWRLRQKLALSPTDSINDFIMRF